MARDDKPLTLRPVDDEDVVESTPVIRLENPETEARPKETKPVRLGPQGEDAHVSRRLALPDKEEIELRTHQPGIEALIEPDAAPAELVEENWGEASARRNPVPWGWFALLGLVIAGGLVWSLSRVEQGGEQLAQTRLETQTVLVDEAMEQAEAARLIERIEGVMRAFFEAKTVETLATMARHPERVTPLMREYYGDGPVYGGSLQAVKTLQPLTLGNRGNFWMASAALSGGKSRNLIIEVLENGEPKIDWETLVCHQPMPWDKFVATRPAGTSMDFRVYVEPDNFYSHEFADPSRWTSYRLTTLNSDETLFGYTAAGSEVAAQLQTLLEQNGGRRTSLILRLIIPDGLLSRRGVVIEEILSVRWLYIDPPDSGS